MAADGRGRACPGRRARGATARRRCPRGGLHELFAAQAAPHPGRAGGHRVRRHPDLRRAGRLVRRDRGPAGRARRRAGRGGRRAAGPLGGDGRRAARRAAGPVARTCRSSPTPRPPGSPRCSPTPAHRCAWPSRTSPTSSRRPAATRCRSARAPASGCRCRCTPDHLVSVYYTSGSTGAPKGVASTHGGWVNRMRWMQRHHPLEPGETVLHKTTLTFDDSAVEIFWPLLYGGRVAVLGAGPAPRPAGHRRRGDRVPGGARAASCRACWTCSSTRSPTRTWPRLGALRSVLSSGEALRPELVRRFAERFGDRVPLDNTWGATEVSIDSTCRVCTAGDADGAGAAVSVGPADRQQLGAACSTPASTRCRSACRGELYIGGIGPGPRLPGRPGPHRRGVRAAPDAAGRADVPHRRPGAAGAPTAR